MLIFKQNRLVMLKINCYLYFYTKHILLQNIEYNTVTRHPKLTQEITKNL